MINVLVKVQHTHITHYDRFPTFTGLLSLSKLISNYSSGLGEVSTLKVK